MTPYDKELARLRASADQLAEFISESCRPEALSLGLCVLEQLIDECEALPPAQKKIMKGTYILGMQQIFKIQARKNG